MLCIALRCSIHGKLQYICYVAIDVYDTESMPILYFRLGSALSCMTIN